MRRETLTLTVTFFALLSVWPRLTRAEESPAYPTGLVEAYGKLSKAMRSADMPSFMSIFHLDYIFEATDGSCLDRGPWRRLWLTNFEERKYEQVSFELAKLLQKEGDRCIVRSRGVLLLQQAGAKKQLRETYFEDSWVQADGGWKLLYRKEIEVRTEGSVLTARAAHISSPRIAALARDLKHGKVESLQDFWEELGKAAPLIEAIPGDDTCRWVTFVWRARGGETAVALRGGEAQTDESPKPLNRLGETELWYRTERIPWDARFTYEFHLTKSISVPFSPGKPAETCVVSSTSRDLLNSKTIDDKSAVEMAEAPSLRWAEAVPDRPAGTFDRHGMQSKILDERRIVSVYTPPGYGALDSTCKAVLLFGGGDYKGRMATRVVLDNLIAERKIPPVVVLLIHNEGSRRPVLEFSGDFVRFVSEEVLPWARETFHFSEKPEDTVMGGSGTGAAIAAWCGLQHPELFGNLLVQCGAFWDRPAEAETSIGSAVDHAWLAREFAKAPTKALRLHIEVGTLESARVLSTGQHFRDVLEARGYPLTYAEFNGNRNSVTWRGSLARGLVTLLGG
jgi:enterochelin esterase family protein